MENEHVTLFFVLLNRSHLQVNFLHLYIGFIIFIQLFITLVIDNFITRFIFNNNNY
jgi:hypothetical protein